VGKLKQRCGRAYRALLSSRARAGSIFIIALFAGSCYAMRSSRNCSEPVDRSTLVRSVTLEQIRAESLSQVEAETLPAAARRGLEEWIDAELRKLAATKEPRDEIWYYKYEKCCGWYRGGYYLIRGDCIVAELNTREDM
jgi:hypothetical protein